MGEHVVNLLGELSGYQLGHFNQQRGAHRVGAITTAAICPRLYGSSRLTIRSRVGMTNDKVLPEPVTALRELKQTWS